MRKMMWFTLGVGAACGLCSLFFQNGGLAPFVLFSLAAAAVCLWIRRRNLIFAILGTLLLGISFGSGWFVLYRNVYTAPVAEYDDTITHLSVTASDYPVQTRYGWSVEAVAQLDGKYYKMIVYLKDSAPLSPGDVLESDFRLRLTTPGGAKESTYYQGNGIFLVATQKGETVLHPCSKTPVWYLPAVIAQSAKRTLNSCFPEDTATFAKALLLGDTDTLSYEDDTALKVSGIRHIAAVSGLHVSILFGVIFFLCGKRRLLSFFVSFPVLLLFAAITGFTPSVTRACLMTGLMVLGSAILEEYDGITGLSFACLVMMLVNPFVLYSVSFQLSVSSVAGILLFAGPIYQRFCSLFPGIIPKSLLGRSIRWVGGSLSVSISAAIITTPLSACYFGTVSLVGIVTNLVTIWAMGIVFVCTGAVSIFGFFFPTLGTGLAHWISWLIRYVMGAAKLLSAFPFSAVYTQSEFIVWWLVLCYAMLAAFLACGRKRLKLALSLVASSLVVAIALSVIIPRLDSVRLTVLDVGEGQSILLQSKGQGLLIDCGGDSDAKTANVAAQTLLSQGVSHLDGLAVTHYDYDHICAIKNLLTRITVDRLYLPVMDGEDLKRWAEKYPNCEIVPIETDTVFPFGVGTVTLTEPGNRKTSNENCMCVLFVSQKCGILVTIDRSRSGEKQLLKDMEIPRVDILIAGHHGSKNSTSYELLEAVQPETVVISVGRGNSYGHPAQEVLDRLEEFHCTVYRTDLQGSVVIRR